MLKELSDNLNLLMAKARINSSELAKAIGVPATTIKRLRNNENANPTITTLLPIAQYFSVSLNQLIGKDSLQLIEQTSSINDQSHKIPLFSWQECINYTLIDYAMHQKHISTERSISPKAFALFIDDNDLAFFPKNSILIVEPERKPETGDYIVVANTQQSVASIRKYIVEIDQIYLKPVITGIDVSILTPEYSILGVIIQYKVEIKF